MIAHMTNTDDLPVLNLRHKKVADEYLKTGNQTQAAVNAGYSPRSARHQGPQILGRSDVQAYLAAQKQNLQSAEDNLQLQILSELKSMAFGNIADFVTVDSEGLPQVDFSKASREQLKAVTNVKTKRRKIYDAKGKHIATEQQADFGLADKYRGLELLGKTLGLFKEAEQRVTIDVSDRLLRARQRLLTMDREIEDGDFKEIQGGGGAGV